MLNVTRQLLETLIATERGTGARGIHVHVSFHSAVVDPVDAVAQTVPELGFFFGAVRDGNVSLLREIQSRCPFCSLKTWAQGWCIVCCGGERDVFEFHVGIGVIIFECGGHFGVGMGSVMDDEETKESRI